jgi:hypothetical protein
MPVYDDDPSIGTPQWTITYQYLGGVVTWHDPIYTGPSRSPVKLDNALPGWVLAADGIYKNANGTWGSPPPHVRRGTTYPDGANEVLVDSSVAWYKWERLLFLSTWNLDRVCGFYQDDLGAIPPNCVPLLKLTP